MNLYNNQERIRVLLVGKDSHTSIRLGDVLGQDDEIELIGMLHDDELIVDRLNNSSPFLIITEIDDQRIAHLKQLLADTRHLPCAVLVIVPDMKKSLILSSLRLGVRGFLTEDAPPSEITRAVKGVGAGEVWVPREILYQAFTREVRRSRDQQDDSAITRKDLFSQLTPRELEVLFCLREGLSDKEIARELDISHKTVKTHLQHIFKKTKVHSRLQLAVRG